MIKSAKLKNFLSFGSDAAEIDLRPLNVIIGTNGSGKSNFLEVFDVLKHAPTDIGRPISAGGGVTEWIHKNRKQGDGTVLEFVVDNPLPNARFRFRYLISFDAKLGRFFEIDDEKIESESPLPGHDVPFKVYDYANGKPIASIKGKDEKRRFEREEFDTGKSILAQKHDSGLYPEIASLASMFSKITLFREWTFGPNTPLRLPQKVDMKKDFLEPDCSNVSLVLSELLRNPTTKKRLLFELNDFYGDFEDFFIAFPGGYAEINFHERGIAKSIPLMRLSDGTIRYLCLLSILCHPEPPPLICLDEPELGMHPDIIPNIAKLLVEASERCQLIVTTHSKPLVDALTGTPEDIIVAEKMDMGTQLERLCKNRLKTWLEEYSLGEMWARGGIGGVRW